MRAKGTGRILDPHHQGSESVRVRGELLTGGFRLLTTTSRRWKSNTRERCVQASFLLAGDFRETGTEGVRIGGIRDRVRYSKADTAINDRSASIFGLLSSGLSYGVSRMKAEWESFG